MLYMNLIVLLVCNFAMLVCAIKIFLYGIGLKIFVFFLGSF